MRQKYISSLCHRDKERVRHQMLNKALEHLSSIIPGKKQKETKAFKLKRILSYVKFLHNKRSQMAKSLLSGDNRDICKSTVSNPKQNTKKANAPNPRKHKAEIVFLKKGSQLPHLCSRNELMSKEDLYRPQVDSLNIQSLAIKEHTIVRISEDSTFSANCSDKSSISDSYSSSKASINDEITFIESNANQKSDTIDYDLEFPFMDIVSHTIDVQANDREYVNGISSEACVNEIKRLKNSVMDNNSKFDSDNERTLPQEYISDRTLQDQKVCKYPVSFNLNDAYLNNIVCIENDSDEFVKKNLTNPNIVHRCSNATEFIGERGNPLSTFPDSNTYYALTSKANKSNSSIVASESCLDEDKTDDQIVPSFINALVNFHKETKSEVDAGENNMHCKDVVEEKAEVFDKAEVVEVDKELNFVPYNMFFKDFSAYNSSPVTKEKYLSSEASEINSPVFTELSNQHPSTSYIIQKGSCQPDFVNSADNNIFYRNYIFPTPEENYSQNSLPRINSWFNSRFGSFTPCAYGQNEPFQNHINYLNFPQTNVENRINEKGLCGQNILLSHNAMNNNSDLIQDLVDVRHGLVNTIPSYYSIFNEAEIKKDFDVNMIPESLCLTANSGSYFTSPKSSPPKSNLNYDENFVTVKYDDLINREIKKPSFDVNVDFDNMFSSGERGNKERKKRGIRSMPKRRNIKLQSNHKKPITSKPALVNRSDQIVPVEKFETVFSSPEVEKNEASNKNNKLLRNVKHLVSNLEHFSEMENSFLSFDGKVHGQYDLYRNSNYSSHTCDGETNYINLNKPSTSMHNFEIPFECNEVVAKQEIL